jgi:uncharacterized membrane protein
MTTATIAAVADGGPVSPPGDAIHLPGFRALARHALPGIVEGALVPALLLFVGLKTMGIWGGLSLGLAWSYAGIVRRWTNGRRVTGLLLLAAFTLTLRTVISGISGNLGLYLVQPALGEIALGLAFAASLAARTPLVGRLAGDFVPLGDLEDRPAVAAVFRQLTAVWAVVFVLNGLLGLWLLLTRSADTYILVRPTSSLAVRGVGVALSILWFRMGLQRRGIKVRMGTMRALG